MDFNRGAAKARGGKAIIALPSTAKDGTISRIVTRLSPGAGVVTTRAGVHYVVTEYGVAYLHGKSIQERALALISIAHPNFRAQLLREAIEAKYLSAELADMEGKILVGPKELRTTYLLNDGTQINFRPIHPTDEPRMRDLFYELSQQTIYYRFMSYHEARPAPADPGLRLHRPPQRRDHRRHAARGARRGHHRRGQLLPRSRRRTWPKWRSSCTTTGRTTASARSCSSTSCASPAATASAASPPKCSTENKAMQAVFNKSNCKIKTTFAGNVISFEMAFD